MVIQRWQSVLLLIGCVLMALNSFLTLGQLQCPDFTLDFTASGFSYAGEPTSGAPTGYAAHTWLLLAVSVTSALLPLVAIFCYRNTSLQKRLTLIGILFIMTTIVCGITYGYQTFDEGRMVWDEMCCAPLLALVAECLAWRRIRSDEKKLAAADRIR